MLASFVAIPAVAEEQAQPATIFIKNNLVVDIEYEINPRWEDIIFVTRETLTSLFPEGFGTRPILGSRSNLESFASWAGYTVTRYGNVFWMRNDGLKPIMVSIDGTLINFPDQQPIIQSGSTLVPVAALARALGAEASWDGARQLATITQGNRVIEITIGQSTMRINGAASQLAIPAQVINGRTMIPLRATAEALGVGVEWEPGEEINWIRKSS